MWKLALILVLGLGCASSGEIVGWYPHRPVGTRVIVVDQPHSTGRTVGQAESIQRSRAYRRGW